MKKSDLFQIWIPSALGVIFVTCIIGYGLAIINELKDIDEATTADQTASLARLEPKLLKVLQNKHKLQSAQVLNGDFERIAFNDGVISIKKTQDALTNNASKVAKGTAVTIYQKNYFLTAEHCIDDGPDVFLIPRLTRLIPDDLEACRATVVWKTKEYDLALLYAPGLDLIPMKLAENQLFLDDQVISIGQNLAVGVIQQVQAQQDGNTVKILHTTPVVKGDSGGAILNNKGQVVGVNAAYFLNKKAPNFKKDFVVAALKLQPYANTAIAYMLSSDALESIISHHKNSGAE